MRQLRHSVSLLQIDRLDGLSIWPPVEQPRLNGPDRRLNFQEGSPKRALSSVVGHEDEVVVPSDVQVDRALRHVLPKWSDRFSHMLRFREYVKNECDGSVELSGDDNLEFIREFDDRRAVPVSCHCCSPSCCSSLR